MCIPPHNYWFEWPRACASQQDKPLQYLNEKPTQHNEEKPTAPTHPPPLLQLGKATVQQGRPSTDKNIPKRKAHLRQCCTQAVRQTCLLLQQSLHRTDPRIPRPLASTTLQPLFQVQPLESTTQLSSASGTTNISFELTLLLFNQELSDLSELFHRGGDCRSPPVRHASAGTYFFLRFRCNHNNAALHKLGPLFSPIGPGEAKNA